MRKVAAQEFNELGALRRLYTTVWRHCEACRSTCTVLISRQQNRGDEAVLRVFHVQNAPWATQYLLRKFNIHNRDDLVGTDFGKFVKHKRPERRGGKPFMSGKSWKTTRDPWRGISRTSFGLDYLKPLEASHDSEVEAGSSRTGKMMELNCYDSNGNPTYGYDGETSSCVNVRATDYAR